MADNASLLPVLIAGPTASGKSALALALAEKLGGVIINADSMQVYDTLDELTARPPEADLRRAPHKLYGHVPAAAAYSVGQWQAAALQEIDAARAAGLVPVVVGGTGLYFASLTEGLVELPAIDAAVRAHWRERLSEDGPAALHAALAEVDSILAARLPPSDPQRIVRGLEVFHSTGRALSDWQQETPAPPLATAIRLVLMPDRDWLYARCDRRFEQMMAGAALAEVERLWALNLPPDAPVMKALGVAELMALLLGETDRATAIAGAQQATRRYAKRQMTWFRNRMRDWASFSEKDYESNFDKIFSYISQNSLTET